MVIIDENNKLDVAQFIAHMTGKSVDHVLSELGGGQRRHRVHRPTIHSIPTTSYGCGGSCGTRSMPSCGGWGSNIPSCGGYGC